MNLYEIRRRLESMEKAVFTLNELSGIIGKPKNVSAVYTNRMCKRKLLYRIEKNKFSKTEDVFIISSQLTYPSYIGLTSSLYLQNEFSQIIDKIDIITSKQKKNMKINKIQVRFIKINPELMFGYKKIRKENSFVMISDLEKTIIDVLLFQNYARVNLLELIRKADHEKLISYTKLANKEVLTRRIGFLLDMGGIANNLRTKTKTIYKFNPRRKNKGKYNNKWRLYVNEVIE